jgi:hypothetical protein
VRRQTVCGRLTCTVWRPDGPVSCLVQAAGSGADNRNNGTGNRNNGTENRINGADYRNGEPMDWADLRGDRRDAVTCLVQQEAGSVQRVWQGQAQPGHDIYAACNSRTTTTRAHFVRLFSTVRSCTTNADGRNGTDNRNKGTDKSEMRVRNIEGKGTRT